MILDIGFEPAPLLPQLVCLFKNCQLAAIISNIVDDLLLARLPAITDPIIAKISARIDLGTIVHKPGHLRYFQLNLQQAADLSTSADSDDKLNGAFSMQISLLCFRDLLSPLTTVTAKAYASLK